jgi:hypothetical protein
MQETPEPSPALPAMNMQQPSRELIHTLNNQLTVVSGTAECALDSDEPEQLRRALHSILLAANKMADTVRCLASPGSRASAGARRELS